MTLTTRVRFLAPIDPRQVWSHIQQLVNAPAEYRSGHVPRHDATIDAPNPSIWAEPEQGGDAWPRLYYGAEGSRLIEDDDEQPPPPAAYAELRLDIGYHDGTDAVQQRIVTAVRAWSPVPVCWRDDHSAEWGPVT